MKRFRRIFVAVDDTDRQQTALEQARTVARESGAALTLTRALEPPPRLLRTLYPQANELHTMLRREWQTRLEELAEPLLEEGMEVGVRLIEGRPFVAYTREVIENDHDLLVKSADPSKESFFLGSTDMHLLRKCPAAVWITNGATPTSARILALVDPDPEEEEVNLRILQMATSLAEMRGTSVDLVHVRDTGSEQLLARRASATDVEAYVEQTHAFLTGEVEQLIERSAVDLPRERFHLRQGDVRREVAEFVRANEIGLIVMGTLGRSGLRGVLIGNTAETILSHAGCPVLTVKPKDFVSPLAD